MAGTPTKGDSVCDVVEFSDSDDSFAMEEFKHKITRTDWLQVFKKKCQDEKFVELENESTVPSDECVLLPSDECIPLLVEECFPLPADEGILPQVTKVVSKRNTRSSSRSYKNTEILVEEPIPITLPNTQRKRTRRGSSNSTATASPVPKRNRKKGRNQRSTTNATGTVSPASHRGRRGTKQRGATRQAAQGTRRSRRIAQSNSRENSNLEVVFVSDDDSSEISVLPRGVANNRIHATNTVNMDDSIEIISVSSHKDSGDEETDEQNRKVNVIFYWRNKVLKLPMKQSTQFGTILSELSSDWDVQGSDIMLLYEDKIVNANDTPSTYEMLSGSVIECSVVKSKMAADTADPNVITIKLQTKNTREKKPMAVHQMTQFQSIIEQFAKEEGVAVDKIVFKFDGDTISPTDTPFDLGIEDNFSIDVIC